MHDLSCNGSVSICVQYTVNLSINTYNLQNISSHQVNYKIQDMCQNFQNGARFLDENGRNGYLILVIIIQVGI